MPDNNNTEIELDTLLKAPFVINLLGLLSRLRDALGDTNGELSHDELVKRAQDSYNQSK